MRWDALAIPIIAAASLALYAFYGRAMPGWLRAIIIGGIVVYAALLLIHARHRRRF